MTLRGTNTLRVAAFSLLLGSGYLASAAPQIATKPSPVQTLPKPGELATSLVELFAASSHCMRLSLLFGPFDAGPLKRDGWRHLTDNLAQRRSDSEDMLSKNAILMIVKPTSGRLTCRLIARLPDEATAPSIRSDLFAKLSLAPLSSRKAASQFLKRNPGLTSEQVAQYYENDQVVARFKIEPAEGKVFGNVVFGPNIKTN
jgi:hypothetical protein